MVRNVVGLTLMGAVAASMVAVPASASETKAYVLSWFGAAAYSKPTDCPEGQNPKADVMFRRILKEMGKTPKEMEEIYKDFPYPIYGIASDRGRIDGKPTNVYITPTSWPDPHIKTATGAKETFGFNLDNNEATGGFTDVDTGEKGVDNQAYRALGCFETQRGVPPERPTYPFIQWDMTRDFQGAWIVEVSGIDDMKNDDDVTIGVYHALEPVTRDAASKVQADMTFKINPSGRSQNTVKGKIKNGFVVSDQLDFYMTGDPLAIADYDLRRARIRLQLKPDGTMSGTVAGYQSWKTIYSGFALPGATNEINLSVDVPGIYYALKRLADADPDPKTGENTRISSSYTMDGVSAFITHPKDGRVADSK
jgi:hypothetical protein